MKFFLLLFCFSMIPLYSLVAMEVPHREIYSQADLNTAIEKMEKLCIKHFSNKYLNSALTELNNCKYEPDELNAFLYAFKALKNFQAAACKESGNLNDMLQGICKDYEKKAHADYREKLNECIKQLKNLLDLCPDIDTRTYSIIKSYMELFTNLSADTAEDWGLLADTIEGCRQTIPANVVHPASSSLKMLGALAKKVQAITNGEPSDVRYLCIGSIRNNSRGPVVVSIADKQILIKPGVPYCWEVLVDDNQIIIINDGTTAWHIQIDTKKNNRILLRSKKTVIDTGTCADTKFDITIDEVGKIIFAETQKGFCLA